MIAVSEITKKNIDSYIANPTSVVLICGVEGSGKSQLVDEIISRLKNDSQSLLETIIIDRLGQAISIEDVRSLKSKLRLKVVKHSEHSKRIVVIHNAETMTHEAQNSLLKLIEDVPDDTMFILTSDVENRLLPTIRSRTQQIYVVGPTKHIFYKKYPDVNKQELDRTIKMVDGRARYLDEIISGDNTKLNETFVLAKQFVASKYFDRLCQVDNISKNIDLKTFIFCLEQIFRSLLSGNKVNKQSEKYLTSLKLLAKTEYDLDTASPNTKLLLTNLALNL